MNKQTLHPQNINQAALIIKAGRVCAFPTETVYGLGADATNDDAVLSIYQTKNRPSFNPLIVHCADIKMAKALVEFSPLAKKLAQFWPGPLTLVLPMKKNTQISNIVSAGLDTLAVRIPANKTARELLKATGKPLAAPSANPSGQLSPTNAQMVKDSFNNKLPVLDGGACSDGLESTILAINNNEIIQLRAGALAREIIEQKIGRKITIANEKSKVSAPGMLKSHYAPKANLRLNVTKPKPNEAYLAFGKTPDSLSSDFSGTIKNLSPKGDLKQAAKNLFYYLNQLDDGKMKIISVAPIPNTGLGEAINDRLKRASAPR